MIGKCLSDAVIEVLLQDVDKNFSIATIVANAASYRGRPIELVPRPGNFLGPDKYGAWLAGETTDYVFFDSETASIHQNHIIMHELCHMILGHETVMVDDQTTSGEVVLMRSYSKKRLEKEEIEAESLALAVQEALLKRLGAKALANNLSSHPGLNQVVIQSMDV